MFCGHATIYSSLARVSDANASAMDRLNTSVLALVMCATALEDVDELAAMVWLKTWRATKRLYRKELSSPEANLTATRVRENAMKNTLLGELVSRCATVDDALWSRVFLSVAVEHCVVDRLGEDSSLVVQQILRQATPAVWHTTS